MTQQRFEIPSGTFAPHFEDGLVVEIEVLESPYFSGDHSDRVLQWVKEILKDLLNNELTVEDILEEAVLMKATTSSGTVIVNTLE